MTKIAVLVVFCVIAFTAFDAGHFTPFAPHGLGGITAAASLAAIVDRATGSTAGGSVIAFGAVVAIASVVLTVLYGQTRILLAMSRDGLVARVFEHVSPRTATPVANTWIVAALVAVLAAVVPLAVTVGLTTIGTLAITAVVNVCVIVLRLRRPDLRRSFAVPLYPVSPLLPRLAGTG